MFVSRHQLHSYFLTAPYGAGERQRNEHQGQREDWIDASERATRGRGRLQLIESVDVMAATNACAGAPGGGRPSASVLHAMAGRSMHSAQSFVNKALGLPS